MPGPYNGDDVKRTPQSIITMQRIMSHDLLKFIKQICHFIASAGRVLRNSQCQDVKLMITPLSIS